MQPPAPRPPGPEQSAEWRRIFAEEARADRPDLSLLCLLIGAQADASLDQAGIDAAQMELDRLAGELPYRPGGPRAWAAALAGLLGERYGLHGTPSDYERLQSSLLHEVLRRRRGLPILLSVLWTEVARRAGAPVYGVALPGHFVVGFGEGRDQVLVNPFDHGRILSTDDTRALIAETTGVFVDLGPSSLVPADPLDVVLRVLNNIRAWAAARPERSDVSLWAVDLSLLLPSHPASLRQEHAEVLVRRGEFVAGAAELDAYAEVLDSLDVPAAERLRAKAREARAMLN